MRFRTWLNAVLSVALAFAGITTGTVTAAASAHNTATTAQVTNAAHTSTATVASPFAEKVATTTCPYRNVKLEWTSPDFGGTGVSTAGFCTHGRWTWLNAHDSTYYGTLVPTPTAGVGILHMTHPASETFIAGVGPMLYGDTASTVQKYYKQDAPLAIKDKWGNKLDALTAEAVLHRSGLAP